MISEIIPVFSRKVIFGYESVAVATVLIGFISLGVWAHHMFAVGMSRPADMFFAGVQLPHRGADRHQGLQLGGDALRRPLHLATPLLFCLGFLGMFLIGGLTGIMLAAAPVDWQMTDSYFVVGHFHFVLFGGTLFAVMAGLYYWFPKVTGRMLNERLGRWHFWLLFIGFNMVFIPMHFVGMFGMPRRYYTYPPNRGWDIWNQISTVGGVRAAGRLPDSCLEHRRSRCGRGRLPATIPGTPGPWNGRPPPRRRRTISRSFPRSAAAARCGT